MVAKHPVNKAAVYCCNLLYLFVVLVLRSYFPNSIDEDEDRNHQMSTTFSPPACFFFSYLGYRHLGGCILTLLEVMNFWKAQNYEEEVRQFSEPGVFNQDTIFSWS